MYAFPSKKLLALGATAVLAAMVVWVAAAATSRPVTRPSTTAAGIVRSRSRSSRTRGS